ncbi:Uncharacterized protein SCF082_LOCUS52448 [Durusdinium trenchii]|uniref:Uncharacterized protein n=1 Tax=Durusdinium trenchii TaxID=1381693 RepID=A0ABP0SL83_9DINO
MAMNSVNSSAIASGELECMLTLAELHISGMKMQDAMNAVQRHSLALTRTALAAAMLTSKKHQDGVSKLIYKSDFDRLKGKASTRQLDEMLTSMWKQAEELKNPDLAYRCWGTAAVRLVLHCLNKEKAAKAEAYESFEKIVQLFSEELTRSPLTRPIDSSASTGGPDAGVRDLLNASSQEVALLQNSHIKIGGRYCNSEYPDQLLVLKSLDDHKATFEHRPLFGEALVVHEDLDSLRKWKATKKDVTTMCPKAVCIARLPHNLDMVQKEMDKAQATALLMEAYMTNKPNDDTLLAFTCHPANLVLMKNVKKKQLKLYPMGTCSFIPAKEQETFLEKTKNAVVWYKEKPYQVQAFKAFSSFTKPDTEAGTLCPYFWVKSCDDQEEVNLQKSWTVYKGLKIPILENGEMIEAQTVLLKSAEQLEQPPAKKGKAKAS